MTGRSDYGSRPLSVISYGGGVQSTALIVLATQGEIDAQIALFANVGDDSEHPATLRYVREVMTPWAAARGVTIHELSRRRRDGRVETLMGRVMSRERSIDIPVRMASGAPGNRRCTADFKLAPIAKWLKAHGASAATPATVYVGISFDEVHRIGRRRETPHERVEYPLADRRMTRYDCARLIAAAGLPVPPKSSCWICPFQSPDQWARMRRDEPALFADAEKVEALINVRRSSLGKDQVWLTRFARPIGDAIQPAERALFETPQYVSAETCDEGACWI